ncbi:hypothetical protein C8N32_10456 [Rhodovulum imhoffii]|uniref:Glycosyl transferase family 25 n=1 Tax=Rhodovulum imhoffii TaxID=365340 RepID=A0A2T5BU06_9RHOB|nr:hypothetical protein [Rhodovulum imhoffii]PTN02945.1 hypothetical protein C8N32_10456 [Rhodovulum imhoffii]
MKTARAWRALRREGMAGVWARMRYRRSRRGAVALAPVQTPIRVRGTSGDALQDVKQALAALGVLHGEGQTPAAHDLYVISASSHLPPPTSGSLLLTSPEIAGTLAPSLARRAAQDATAILTPGAGFDALVGAGVPPGQVFVLPSPGESGESHDMLAAGLTRWLVAAGGICAKGLTPEVFPALRNLSPQRALCLSLPETPARRRAFTDRHGTSFTLFDGIRLSPGWHGAAFSYATMARAALAQGVVPLTVCEDDVALAPDYAETLRAVRAYLRQTDWDIFSGLVTNLAGIRKTPRAVLREGHTFVHLDQTIGMVFNIYNRRALERLADWAPDRGGIGTNSIDAWLGTMPGLRVVTTLPFLAGHRGDLTSSIFGFSNRRYDSMIKASERLLARRSRVVSDDGHTAPSRLVSERESEPGG